MTNDEFHSRQELMLRLVPFEVRGALAHLAYEQGHSSGHENVLGILAELVETLEEPLEKLRKRLTNQPN